MPSSGLEVWRWKIACRSHFIFRCGPVAVIRPRESGSVRSSGVCPVSFPTSHPAAVNIQLVLSGAEWAELATLPESLLHMYLPLACWQTGLMHDRKYHLTQSVSAASSYIWFSVSEVTPNFREECVTCACLYMCMWAFLVNITSSDTVDETGPWQASSGCTLISDRCC